MLEVRSPEDTNAIFEEDESQKRALIEIYFAAVCHVTYLTCLLRPFPM